MISTMDEKSIIALCTPRGKGAIALIRISGNDAIAVIDKIAQLSSREKLANLPSHTIHHGHVVDISQKNELIDEVLFFLMKEPKTFTGQNSVEISCHNNPFIIEKIIEQAITCGAHRAQAGEFTKRAFLNNKIDLIQAEAIHDVIAAQTEIALKKSMSQLKGSLSYFLKKIENKLIELLSLIETSFEFLDEEQRDFDFDNLIRKKIDKITKITKQIKTNFNQQQQIKQGIRIALLGSVNVGKSTLFNTLLKEERAIVTNIKGTTRDCIEKNLYKNGAFWLLLDTAGLRKTDNIIEQKGVNKTWKEAIQSDIIILIFDLTKQLSEEENKIYKSIIEKHHKKIILVANKIDKKTLVKQKVFPQMQNVEIIKISAKQKIGISELENKIETKIQKLFEKLNSPYLLNQRQQSLILELNIKFKYIAKKCTNRIQYELIGVHIREVLEMITELTGKNINERVIDNIFSNFCIGK